MDVEEDSSRSLKGRVLEYCQGARYLSFRGSMMSAPSIARITSKRFNASTVYFTDSLAHDIIDCFLSERETPTVCKFAFMHHCREPTNLGLPCVDDCFISAPCCLAPLYSMQPLKDSNVSMGKVLGSSDDMAVGSVTPLFRRRSLYPGTSTPKHHSSGPANRLDTERNCTSSTSSGSSCTCEHHETPSGLNSKQHSIVKNMTVEPPASSSLSTNNYFPRHSTFKSNSFSEPSCNYKESLHVNTNFDHLCRKLFVNLSSDHSEDNAKQNGSTESVIRHPSYFSDSGSGGAADDDTDCTGAELNMSVFVETRSNCCSPFREEEICALNKLTCLDNEPSSITKRSVATQTTPSYLSQRTEKPKRNSAKCALAEKDGICEKMTETHLHSPEQCSNFSSMSDIFVVATEETREQIQSAALRSV